MSDYAGLDVLDIFSFYVRADVDFDEVRAALRLVRKAGRDNVVLCALPADIDLSVEWSAPPPGPTSADAWAKQTFETAREFLRHYHADRTAPPQPTVGDGD